jgi:O-acetyl-ADP-ribose deacetylase (regulator of RNase III)
MRSKVILFNLLELNVDAIVNPSNPLLQHGGGLCGIIYDHILKSGKDNYQVLINQINTIPLIDNKGTRCRYGDVIITKVPNQKFKYLFHTVGAMADKHTIDEQIGIIYNCYYNCIKKANELGLKNIAVPMIGSGLYGVDKKLVFTCFNNACLKCKHMNIDVYLVIVDKNEFELIKTF